jgi:preprotein translocase subunit SecF
MSTNQVLLRSVNTTLAAALPVLSLLVVGSWIFGQVTLREFAIALLVGMITGAYSSLFVAAPLLGWLKQREPEFASATKSKRAHLVDADLRAVVIAGPSARPVPGRRRRSSAQPAAAPAAAATSTPPGGPSPPGGATAPTVEEPAVRGAPAKQLLSHPPRPRKKKRR